jgi:hypothetical protein
VIKVEGFKKVTFKNVNINTKSSLSADKLPAHGIHIMNADQISLEKVLIKQVGADGIRVEGGGKVVGAKVASNNNGMHGLEYTGCYARGVAAGIDLSGPSSFFKENENSGLKVDCDYAPLGTTSPVPVVFNNVGFNSNKLRGVWLRGTLDVAAKKCTFSSNGKDGGAMCGGGVRVILRNTATAGTKLLLDQATKVIKNKAKYGAGICFQARSNVPESTTDGNPEATKQSVLKLSGNPWLKDNKAEVCGGGLATIGNMKNERMAIGIDKGIVNSGNQAQPGKGATWCDILNGPEEDTATTVATDWQSYKSIWLSE